ncbi:MAG: response regulator [Clostridiales bacterium]|jgi:two-component system alkaline phosphatase synthesis response regulator PhoP|nr:response regulator [Clostridiales bacterium]
MIYCVEDDVAIREIELYALRSTGFKAMGFEDGASFWTAMEEEKPELVILDIMLPGTDGVELLRKMRASIDYRDIPVIMATAKGSEYDKIQSLDLGADDYVVKPFGVMELVSRVKAVLRRARPNMPGEKLELGEIVLSPEERIVTVQGERVELTFKEFELLRLFMLRPGLAFTREQLFSDVWNMDYTGETRTVDMHIRTLRKKLGKAGSYIKTVRNVGYRMEKEE